MFVSLLLTTALHTHKLTCRALVCVELCLLQKQPAAANLLVLHQTHSTHRLVIGIGNRTSTQSPVPVLSRHLHTSSSIHIIIIAIAFLNTNNILYEFCVVHSFFNRGSVRLLLLVLVFRSLFIACVAKSQNPHEHILKSNCTCFGVFFNPNTLTSSYKHLFQHFANEN